MAREIIIRSMPTVAIRGMAVFPNMQLHFEVSRKQSIAALKAAMAGSREIFLVMQKDLRQEEPTQPNEFYPMGVICTVQQILSSPNSDNLRVAVEGVSRGSVVEIQRTSPYLITLVQQRTTTRIKSEDKDYAKALVRVCKDDFQEYACFVPNMPTEFILDVLSREEPGELADFIASNTAISADKKQVILAELNPLSRMEKLCALLRSETQLLELEEGIQNKVQDQMDQNQREYYLREQMRAISVELDGEEADEAAIFREKIEALDIDEAGRKKLLQECSRLDKTSKSSPEAMVIRTYLETCLALPWNVYTTDDLDLKKAQRKLDDDHYGMEKVKKRMIEMLAVRKLAPDIKGQIICLVGPPGVGKTSIAKSVAAAMGRKYARVSLGGVKDEAEIRGHRKTYIGSMPGRIINAIQQAGSCNPLILLDEVDKLSSDYKGDPSSALLEVLDGEQNDTFRDHYIELPFDLSRVLFITTANNRDRIPQPLLDRMELIELGSYTAEEKFNIAKKHLLPKQAKRHGLNGRTLRVSDAALREIIEGYTREAGVRQLEREIASVCRKGAVAVADGAKSFGVKSETLKDILGTRKFEREDFLLKDEIGVARGLAWTAVGGEMLDVEAAVLDGTGKLELTGSLGDVMKESAHAAISFIRSKADELGIAPDFYKTKDIHLHFPEGAVPKDGPSAGITITTALVSALTGIPVKSSVAMTGEVTLRGRVLPIGGLKEKTMAAYLAGVKTVIIPQRNVSSLDEVEAIVKENVEFVPVSDVSQVLDIALCSAPKAEKKQKKAKAPVEDKNVSVRDYAQ
ncbi:MAG: endopeptidase La [Clostridia bacterium]|nr:endopeptidase La [Clostridia bacterium]